MAEEKKDVIDQLVTGQSVKVQSATEQGVEGQVAVGTQQETATLADSTSQEKDVPYSRFKEANEKAKAAEDAKVLAEQQKQQAIDQLALVQANQTQVQTQQPVSIYEQALIDCGLKGQEYLSQEEQIKVNTRMEQLGVVRTQQNQQAFADQNFAQSHSDFVTAVGQLNQVTGQFMASVELQKILMEKPHLRASCSTAQGAYAIVMQERKLAELSKKTETLEQQQTQQNVDANLAPMSGVAAGGGAVSRTTGQITEKSSAKDVAAMEQRVKAGEFG